MPGDHPEDSVEDCVEDVMAQGHDESSAYAICEASINDKEFEETKLASMLKDSGSGDWIDTVSKLVESDVESSVIADVVERARSGSSREAAQKAMAKSDKIEKVGFEAEVTTAPTVFKADDDFVIWGAASVEVVDKEGDKIQAKALSNALPQLLKRARLSVEHSDQLVGRILERFETDESVTVEIANKKFERSDFPTDVLELKDMKPALYVAGEIFDDSRQARETRKRIEEGEINSYSISGEALVTRKKVTSDGDTYDDIVDLDLSAVTLCEQGMNEMAKFGVVDSSGEKKTAEAETAKSDTPSTSAVASIAKEAITETMSESTTKSGEDSDGFSLEELQAEFKSVLDESLPDGELATKDDVPDTIERDDVESIAREVYNEVKEDVAGEEDDEDEGYSDAESRPDDEDDVEGDEADDYEEKGDAREAAADLADEYDVRTGEVLDAMEALAGSASDADMDDEDEKGDYEDDDYEDDEEKEGEDYEDDEDYEDEEMEDDDYVEEEDEMEDEDYEDEEMEDEEMEDYEEGGKGYTHEELENMLPEDVYEVVREYIDDGEEMEMSAEDEGENPMEQEKSDDIESAVEKILSGSGMESVEGADSPGSDVEKSYDESEEQEATSGGNPALANFYGE